MPKPRPAILLAPLALMLAVLIQDVYQHWWPPRHPNPLRASLAVFRDGLVLRNNAGVDWYQVIVRIAGGDRSAEVVIPHIAPGEYKPVPFTAFTQPPLNYDFETTPPEEIRLSAEAKHGFQPYEWRADRQGTNEHSRTQRLLRLPQAP